MKKMFLAAMAIATIAMVGCKPKPEPPTPGPTPTPGSNVPEIAKPEEGYVTFAIQIPEGSECNGIAVKGTTDGTNWVGADQYLGADGSIAAVDKCAKFEAIADAANWYKVTIKLGAGYEATDDAGAAVTNYMAGKICLVYAGDGSWDGQAVDWAYVDAECTVAVSKSGDGNFQVNGTCGIVYITVGGWQKSECVKEEAKDRVITVTVPAFTGAYEPAVVGSFNGWDAANTVKMTQVEGFKYTATISMVGSDEFKFIDGATGDWSNEIQQLVDGEWKGLDNVKVGDETTFTFDYSAEQYSWSLNDK